MKEKAIYFTRLLLIFLLPQQCLGQVDIIDSLNQLAYEGYRQDVNKGKAWAYQALALSEDAQSPPQIVDSYINLSRCFRIESNWDSAYQVLNIAVVLAEKNRYPKGLMNAHNNLAASYLTQGMPQEFGDGLTFNSK